MYSLTISSGAHPPRIEAPRSKLRGISDPLQQFLLRSLTPQQATGKRDCEFGEANALAGFNLNNYTPF